MKEPAWLEAERNRVEGAWGEEPGPGHCKDSGLRSE